MHDQRGRAIDVDDRVIPEQPAADAPGEFLPEQEVVVALHHGDRQPAGRQLGQRVADLRMGRVVVVVAEPQRTTASLRAIRTS